MHRGSLLRILPALSIPAVVGAGALPAFAQDITAGPLFDKGVADMEAGHFDTGCPAIAESQRLDPRPGTLFTLAECYAKAGKPATAIARYQDYLDLFARMTRDEQFKQQGRDKLSRGKIAALTPYQAQLTLSLASGAPAGTVVTRDGVAIGAATLGLALPSDPGSHTLTTQAPGRPVTTQTITLGKGEKRTVTLEVKTEPANGSTGAQPAQTSTATHTEAPHSGTPSETTAPSKTQLYAGIAVTSIGAAGLVVGAVTGGLAIAKKSSASNQCTIAKSSVGCKDQSGVDAWTSARTIANVSTATLVIGGVATVAGVVVIATAPKNKAQKSASIGVGLGPSGVAVLGAF